MAGVAKAKVQRSPASITAADAKAKARQAAQAIIDKAKVKAQAQAHAILKKAKLTAATRAEATLDRTRLRQQDLKVREIARVKFRAQVLCDRTVEKVKTKAKVAMCKVKVKQKARAATAAKALRSKVLSRASLRAQALIKAQREKAKEKLRSQAQVIKERAHANAREIKERAREQALAAGPAALMVAPPKQALKKCGPPPAPVWPPESVDPASEAFAGASPRPLAKRQRNARLHAPILVPARLGANAAAYVGVTAGLRLSDLAFPARRLMPSAPSTIALALEMERQERAKLIQRTQEAAAAGLDADNFGSQNCQDQRLPSRPSLRRMTAEAELE